MNKLITFLMIILPTLLFAGEKGNGGYSIVCRDQEGRITSAEILDLYEGRVISKNSYIDSLRTYDDYMNEAIHNLKDPLFIKYLIAELKLYEKNRIFIPVGNELEGTEDALPSIRKKGCSFEQVANYLSTGEILISEEIYQHFDEVNKVALALHEAIYSIRRKAVGDTHSKVTRKIVAEILSSSPDTLIIQEWVSDTLYRPNNSTPCGLEGNLYERIQSCLYTKISSTEMVLVSRTKEGKEVWFDKVKRLLWSDRYGEYTNFEEAIMFCASIHDEMGYLYDYEWRLPTADELRSMAPTYITTLPNMNRFGDPFWFWTKTLKGTSVLIFNGADGQISSNPFKNLRNGSVRCVAKVTP